MSPAPLPTDPATHPPDRVRLHLRPIIHRVAHATTHAPTHHPPFTRCSTVCSYNNGFRFDAKRAAWELGAGSVGLGGNISKSLYSVEAYYGKEHAVPAFYEGTGEDAGNGSIMRLSPIPVMFHADVKQAEEEAVNQSRGTHPGNDAAASCQFMTYFMIRAIKEGLPKAGVRSRHCVPNVRRRRVTWEARWSAPSRMLW